jgi:syntaxin 5
VARKKTLFDDRPVEISELTYIIKHDIAAINRQLSDLQAFNKSQGKGKSAMDKAEEHRGNVVTLLQTKLAGATTDFQDILEVRTQVRLDIVLKAFSILRLTFTIRFQNMKASRDRTEQFAFSGATNGRMGENSGMFLCSCSLAAMSEDTD